MMIKILIIIMMFIMIKRIHNPWRVLTIRIQIVVIIMKFTIML